MQVSTLITCDGPTGIDVLDDGCKVVCSQHRIMKIAPDGTLTVLAGSGNAAFGDRQGKKASFNSPKDVAVDMDGFVYVADLSNHRIRKISPNGVVSTLAGSGSGTFGDGQGTTAHFHNPAGVAVDGDGYVYVADLSNHRIRKIAPDGTVTTLAGSGNAAFGDGQGAAASFNSPQGVAVDGDGYVYVADQSNHRIRKIAPEGTVTTLAGSGRGTFADGQGIASHFYNPCKLAVDAEGNVLVSDQSNGRIRSIAALLPPPTRGKLPPTLPSAYRDEMRALLDDSSFADIAFVVEGEKVTAHRALLSARSEYFRTMLSASFREAQPGSEVPIGGMSSSAFKELLAYIYTDELVFSDKNMIDVMRKARECQLDRVYNHTVRRCHRDLSVQNAVMWFIQADQYKLDDLRESALRFVARNFRRIRAEAKPTLLPLQEKPALMMEVMLDAI